MHFSQTVSDLGHISNTVLKSQWHGNSGMCNNIISSKDLYFMGDDVALCGMMASMLLCSFGLGYASVWLGIIFVLFFKKIWCHFIQYILWKRFSLFLTLNNNFWLRWRVSKCKWIKQAAAHLPSAKQSQLPFKMDGLFVFHGHSSTFVVTKAVVEFNSDRFIAGIWDLMKLLLLQDGKGG